MRGGYNKIPMDVVTEARRMRSLGEKVAYISYKLQIDEKTVVKYTKNYKRVGALNEQC